jgi:omega-amidase
VQILLTNPDLIAGDTQGNLDALRRLLSEREFETEQTKLGEQDLLLLPEHFHFGPPEGYLDDVRELAELAGCHVVAGSHHEPQAEKPLNSGVVMAPDGSILHRYDKLRPYAEERKWVKPGSRTGSFLHEGRRVGVLVCADFWFNDLFLAETMLPELLLVPALSVTRKPTADYSRELWRHTAIARAYEYGLFVGISDWAASSSLPPLRTAGVSGFADPTSTDPAVFFRPVPRATLFEVDFGALDAFRADRKARGFFWEGRK